MCSTHRFLQARTLRVSLTNRLRSGAVSRTHAPGHLRAQISLAQRFCVRHRHRGTGRASTPALISGKQIPAAWAIHAICTISRDALAFAGKRLSLGSRTPSHGSSVRGLRYLSPFTPPSSPSLPLVPLAGRTVTAFTDEPRARTCLPFGPHGPARAASAAPRPIRVPHAQPQHSRDDANRPPGAHPVAVRQRRAARSRRARRAPPLRNRARRAQARAVAPGAAAQSRQRAYGVAEAARRT